MQVQFIENGVYLPVFLIQVQLIENGVYLPVAVPNIPDAGTVH